MMVTKLIKMMVVAGAISSGFGVAHACGGPRDSVVSDHGGHGPNSSVNARAIVKNPTESTGLTRAEVRQQLLESKESGEFQRLRHTYNGH